MRREPLQVRFHVEAPVGEVHAFVIRDYFANHRRWDPGLIDLVELDEGPVRPGKRGREVRRFLGEQVSEFEITEVVLERCLRMRDVPSMWTLERSYELAPAEDGTQVVFTFDMRPRGAFRLVYPVARRFIVAQVRRNMETLASLLSEHASSRSSSS